MENTETTQAQTSPHANPFEFTGKSMEFFKIWIINIVLSIITLGIYSPWAKVRTKRYFYGNTKMAGSTFEYLADPLAILKGRMIVFAVILVYYVSVSFIPFLGPVFMVAFIIALPWLVVRSMAFNARNSAFRNVRFNFESGLGQAAMTFIALPLFTLITFGLAAPFMVQRMNRFILANSSYGKTSFDMDAGVGSFYMVYLKAFGLFMLLGIIMGVVMAVLMPTLDLSALQQMSNQQQPMPMPAAPPELSIIIGVVYFISILFYIYIGMYIQTQVFNLTFNNTRIGAHSMASTLTTWKMFIIHLTNIIGVIFSVGLLIPWAKIRLARYRINQLNLNTNGSLNDFVAHEKGQVKATGDEFAEAFDMDFGF